MGKGGSTEMVLETRHLVGVFLAAVVLCAVFFTLGFIYGRDQERAAARAAELKARTTDTTPPTPAAPRPGSSPADLGFYDRLGTKPKPEASRPASPRPQPPAAVKVTPTSPPAGSERIFLQVAALTQKDDAERLRAELYRLGFPAVVVPPGSDKLFRVQVGPFTDPELAAAAERRLEAQGFKVIHKR